MHSFSFLEELVNPSRLPIHIAFFLVFDFLWETRKKETFLARKIQENQEFSPHNLLVILNFYVTFFGNSRSILDFWPNLLHSYVTIFSEILGMKQNFKNSLYKCLLNYAFKCLFYLHQFLVFLVCFSCEKFLVIKFLDFLFLMRNCDA